VFEAVDQILRAPVRHITGDVTTAEVVGWKAQVSEGLNSGDDLSGFAEVEALGVISGVMAAPLKRVRIRSAPP
jgi:hypothetical protein